MTARRVRWSQLHIGLAVTALVTVLSGVIFFIDDFRDIIEERYTLYFNTLTNQNISRRAPVWLAGQPVGEVQALRFAPAQPGLKELLSVELAIRSEVRRYITEGAEVQVTTAGLLGEPVVNILPATRSGPPLPDGSVLPAAYVIDPQEAVRHLKGIYDSLPPIVERWHEVLEQAVHGTGTLSRLSQRPEELRQLHGNLMRLAATFDTLGSAASGLNGLFEDSQVRGALSRLGPRIDTLTRRWSDGGGSAGGLARDTAIAGHLDGIFQSIESVNTRLETGRGTLGRLFNDRVLKEELERTRRLLQELRADLRSGAGGR
ncbi:MAG TPA: MlaD family protein [Gemmatimonadota bacterium]|nr:MlaD family protein [Gemmatimonadota bacterium]